jgi:hypothetical protein
VKQISIFHTCAFFIANTFNMKGNILFSKTTWRRRDTSTTTAGWRGGKKKRVEVVASSSSPGR